MLIFPSGMVLFTVNILFLLVSGGKINLALLWRGLERALLRITELWGPFVPFASLWITSSGHARVGVVTHDSHFAEQIAGN